MKLVHGVRFSLVIVALASLIGEAIATGPVHGETKAIQTNALQEAGPYGSGTVATFPSIQNCEISDGVTVVKNSGTRPISIISVSVDTTNSDGVKAAYTILSFPTGKTTGEVSPSPLLTGLSGGTDMGSAIGARLEPIRKGNLWYVVVARLRLVKNATLPWQIRDIAVKYLSGKRVVKAVFSQRINLPVTHNCG